MTSIHSTVKLQSSSEAATQHQTHQQHVHDGDDEDELRRVLSRARQENVDGGDGGCAEHRKAACKELEDVERRRHGCCWLAVWRVLVAGGRDG